MELNNLKPAEGSVKRQGKRVGRGQGSGKGGTATRGHNGAKSRSGYSKKLGFEGGQMPLQQRIPKFGFSSRVNRATKEVNLKNIATMTDVTLESLKENRIVPKSTKKVKIFGIHELAQPMKVSGVHVTKGAKESIEKAGGTIAEVSVRPIKEKFVKTSKKAIAKPTETAEEATAE